MRHKSWLYYFFILISVLSISIISSSCKKEEGIKAKIIKDCSGTYVRVNNKDYNVCNLEMTEGYEPGQTITVKFEKIKECHGLGNTAPICYLYHPYESWIQIKQIK